ncbi:hypothetical protein SDC9_195541 [bioreactor metagenome]|uniref:Uncharacterized protein n=1 Tax=bioreactor metagenome TaxID=1076179 RepID=A0A645I9B6_9ZZZZ
MQHGNDGQHRERIANPARVRLRTRRGKAPAFASVHGGVHVVRRHHSTPAEAGEVLSHWPPWSAARIDAEAEAAALPNPSTGW